MKLLKVESDKAWTLEFSFDGNDRCYRHHVLHCIEARSECGMRRLLDYTNRYNLSEYAGAKPRHLLLRGFDATATKDCQAWEIKVRIMECREPISHGWFPFVEPRHVENFYRQQEREFSDVLPRCPAFEPAIDGPCPYVVETVS